jgi:LemA protein
MNTSYTAPAVATAVILAWTIVQLNKLVRGRNHVDRAWSDVEVQLRRRHDLISNLVETARGYAAHERATFEAVIRARGEAASATGPDGSAHAEDLLGTALASLLSLTEAYPDLKASTNFLAIQAELSTTENKISYARQYYNDGVLDYNNAVGTFPLMIFSRLFGFDARGYFQAGLGSGPPQVRF